MRSVFVLVVALVLGVGLPILFAEWLGRGPDE